MAILSLLAGALLSGRKWKVDKATAAVRRCRKALGLNREIARPPAFFKSYWEI